MGALLDVSQEFAGQRRRPAVECGGTLGGENCRRAKDETCGTPQTRAHQLREEGLSLRGIGRALLAEGHTPRNGKQWHVQVIARLAGG